MTNDNIRASNQNKFIPYAQRFITIIWSVEDVLIMRPDLTDYQAWEVLQNIDRNHDAGNGVNWDVIEFTAAELFGPFPEECQSKGLVD